MDSRRLLAQSVLECGMSLSEACRRAGVTRPTGRKWVARARLEGVSSMSELSRAPHTVPLRTAACVEAHLVTLKREFPDWGAKKLRVILKDRSGIEVTLRTADRILDRHGMTRPRASAEPIQSFERESCGALLQMDFKGLPKHCPYSLLTVLDDHSRYCAHFSPLANRQGDTVFAALWELFGVNGLPDQILMDNGDCWGARSACPTRFEAMLMRLGIEPIHGRPRHPQTQGKVERFHETAELEMKQDLVQVNVQAVREACAAFVDRYNWIRPHESIAQQTPGKLYVRWPRRRPETPPPHHIQEGAVSRKVDQLGNISYKGIEYKVGKGLIDERVVITDDELGPRLNYAGFPLAYIFELNPRRGL